MAQTVTITSIIAAATSNASGATTRQAIDARGDDGGYVHIKLTNGATGPSTQATAAILIANTTGATPATGAAGSTWKTFVSGITAGTANNAVREYVWSYGPGITHIEVEVTGNTGQAVTCEATAFRYVYS